MGRRSFLWAAAAGLVVGPTALAGGQVLGASDREVVPTTCAELEAWFAATFSAAEECGDTCLAPTGRPYVTYKVIAGDEATAVWWLYCRIKSEVMRHPESAGSPLYWRRPPVLRVVDGGVMLSARMMIPAIHSRAMTDSRGFAVQHHDSREGLPPLRI